jgi:signal transduction histidine kinase/CheY-like chemotaxis protein
MTDESTERAPLLRTQRRVRAMLGILLALYLGFVAWLATSGWLGVMQSTPIQPEALALYMALLVLAAAPLALRFLYSRHLVSSLARMARALRQARDEARQGSQAKADFLATMSHEIRTPMNAVIGFSELLGKTQLDATQAEYVAAIRDSGTHLLAVVNDVLDYSKIEAGRIELDEKAFELVPIVESCITTLSLAARQKGLEISFRKADGTPQALFGDAQRLRQVLINLLSNAVKFTARGGIRIHLSARPAPDGRMDVRFEVQDTGVGIPESALPKLFRAFTQADSSSTRRQDGTGLGLAISRRLCELMGGTLTVTSEEGKGSTFVATVRAMPAPVPTRLRVKPPAALVGLRLLVVDDNPMSRTILSRNAQSWGLRVRSTGNPQEALGWIRAGDPFDLAILDHQMQGMDGPALAKAMKETGRDLPPLLLATSSGHVSTLPKEFVARLRKPFLAAELMEAMRAAVGPKRRNRVPARKATLKVLLVEDNLMNQRLALKVLERLGHRAQVARDGSEAVRVVLKQRPDVVLMDVHMPVMDGLEATRAICRRLPPGRRPLIIGLSANALAGERERCLGAGMDDYLPKPMDQEKLAGLLASVEPQSRPSRRSSTMRRDPVV